jgi:hypothetical protein
LGDALLGFLDDWIKQVIVPHRKEPALLDRRSHQLCLVGGQGQGFLDKDVAACA